MKKIDYMLRYLKPPVAFLPALAEMLGGDIHATLFLQQIIYWRDKGSREDGWIYKSDKEFRNEIILTPRICSRVRKFLKGLGILEVRVMKANGVPMNHYRVNEPELTKRIMEFYKMSESSITEITAKKDSVLLRRTGPSPKRYKTEQTTRILDYFKSRCTKYLDGVSPIISARDHAAARYALKTGGLTEAQAFQMIDERFDEEMPPDHKAISVGQVFSARHIEQFKVRNGIKG